MTTHAYRTHLCHELRATNINEEVQLSGWVHRRRDHGGLIFVDLRDRYGLTQLVFDPEKNANSHELAESLRQEWVIKISGTVIPRAEGMANPKLATGAIEVTVDQLTILSKAKTPPFSVFDEFIEVNEELRLKFRFLDIRRGQIAQNLATRHQIAQITRQYLNDLKFLEIQTPILGKSTPEGARDYLVPSRIHPGNFYALPQSPQLLKQMLMISGMDRYYQIATCFRDEDLRADRQPEFTQIDLEMSFADSETLFPMIEGLMGKLFKDILNISLPEKFLRLSYQECIEKYGTDKPDLRFGMPLVRINDIAERSDFSIFKQQCEQGGTIKAICVKGGAEISRKGIDQYTHFVSKFGVKGLAWMKFQEEGLSSSIVKFFSPELQAELIERTQAAPGDLLLMVADDKNRCNQALDHLRRHIAEERNLIKENSFEALWVVDFPLFQWNPDEQRVESEHHPFTSPCSEDIHLLEKEPLKVRSSSYDLVLNGHELASGSQRIHDGDLQTKIFKALNLSEKEIESKFGFFVEALQYGTPPHLGIALGLDRLTMILTHCDQIRDVIAFPKTQKASDLLLKAPSSVSQEQLKELKIRTEDSEMSWL